MPIVKVGTIVEEATRISNRSGKFSEDERREAEEKVDCIFRTRFLHICSGGEVRQVCEGGEGEAVHLLHAQQDPLGGKGAQQEVNLRPYHPCSTVSPSPFLDFVYLHTYICMFPQKYIVATY